MGPCFGGCEGLGRVGLLRLDWVWWEVRGEVEGRAGESAENGRESGR